MKSHIIKNYNYYSLCLITKLSNILHIDMKCGTIGKFQILGAKNCRNWFIINKVKRYQIISMGFYLVNKINQT